MLTIVFRLNSPEHLLLQPSKTMTWASYLNWCVFMLSCFFPIDSSPDSLHTSIKIRGVFMGLAMMGFLHLYMKYTQPLFLQGVMAVKNLYDAKLVQIHILGKPATGDLKRPFKSGGGLFGQSYPSYHHCDPYLLHFRSQVLAASPQLIKPLLMKRRKRLDQRKTIRIS